MIRPHESTTLQATSIKRHFNIHTYIHLPIHTSIHPHIHPSIHPSTYLPTRIYKTLLSVATRFYSFRTAILLRRAHTVSGTHRPSIQCAPDVLSPGAKLTPHQHLVARLRARSSVPPLQHTSSQRAHR
jgi:hypothetical protein